MKCRKWFHFFSHALKNQLTLFCFSGRVCFECCYQHCWIMKNHRQNRFCPIFFCLNFLFLLFFSHCCLTAVSQNFVSVKPNQIFCLDVFQINDDFLPALNQKNQNVNTFSCLFYGRGICCLKLSGLLTKLLSKLYHILVKIIFKNNQILLFLSRNIKEDILYLKSKYWIYSEAKCSKSEK